MRLKTPALAGILTLSTGFLNIIKDGWDFFRKILRKNSPMATARPGNGCSFFATSLGTMLHLPYK
jgi:hypothetical protein